LPAMRNFTLELSPAFYSNPDCIDNGDHQELRRLVKR